FDKVRLEIHCATLTMLLGYAFRVLPDRVTGPDFLSSSRFDIAATIPPGVPAGRIPEMLQSLLIDRFKMSIHLATAERPIYELTILKGGAKLDRPEKFEEPGKDESPSLIPYGDIARYPTSAGYILFNLKMGTVRETGSLDGTMRWEAPSTT